MLPRAAGSPSGFYAWQQRPESRARGARSPAARADPRVVTKAAVGATAARGCPRICTSRASAFSRKRVARLMRAEGLGARVRKRFRSTTMSDHDQPIAANVLDRQFEAARPNQRWVGDTTEFVIGSSAKLYLAAILDLYSRFVVGWALSAVNDRHLTISALDMALKRRCPQRAAASLGSGLHVRQRGLSDAARAARITCSMSRRGNCYDNAVTESLVLDRQERAGDRFEATPTPRRPCSTTSKCSITSGVVTRRSARSARRSSSDGPLTPHSQPVHRIGSSPGAPNRRRPATCAFPAMTGRRFARWSLLRTTP